MLVESVNDLPVLNRMPLSFDVETVSYDDFDFGQDFDGKKAVAGYALCPLDGSHEGWYVPVRHRSGIDGENLPLDEVKQWLREEVSPCPKAGWNIKFDIRMSQQDGMEWWDADLEDMMVMLRLIECDRLSYSLNAAAKDYLKKAKETDLIKEHLRGLKQEMKRRHGRNKEPKDYGLVPARKMHDYALPDVHLVRDLHPIFHKALHEASHDLWASEMEFMKYILKWEIKGIPVNKGMLRHVWRSVIRRLLEISQEIEEITGYEIDPAKDSHVTEYLVGRCGVTPKVFTKKKQMPQWNGMALLTIEADEPVRRVAKLISEFRNLDNFRGTFCEGWDRRIGVDGRLHPDFRIAGTATGRLSCANPNFQNVPPRAENFIAVPEGYVLVAWDYSQIEYRIFGHYTNDPIICDAYINDERADFHGLLAGILGVDRQFAKQLNFSFLYGMGKNKLLKNLAGILSLKADESAEMQEKMRLMAYGSGTSIAQRANQLSPSEEMEFMALQIYDNYHKKFPSIRQLQTRVKNCIIHRGWIKNFFGRVYRLPREAVHRGPNYLIQGTAADLFKNRLLALFKEFDGKFDYQMLTNVHDSGIFLVREDQAEDFYNEGTRILETNVGFRIPLKVEGKVGTLTWGKVEKVLLRDDEESGKKAGFMEAVERSRTASTRLAGLTFNEWEEESSGKTSGRYDFSGTGN